MQKKLFASLLVTVALICACALAASAVGTPADDGVYEISTAKELRDLAHLIADKQSGYGAARKASYRLTKDIDMSGITDMVPIGANSSNAFAGTFDGGGHRIYNLNLVPAEGASGNYWGLFGRVADATITDLTVEGTVTSGGAYVGGILGRTQTNGIEVTGCYNGGTVTSDGQDADGNPGADYAMVIVGRSPAAPTNSNNYYKPGTGTMNSVKAIAVDLKLDSTSAKIYKTGNATVRYITRLTVDDAAAVESYGIMIAKVDDKVDAKYAVLTDSFEGTETTYAVDLVGIPEAARDINIYAWAYVNLAGGVQIVLPVAPVTVNGIIG